MMPIYEQCLTLIIFFYTLSHKTPKIEWNLDCFSTHFRVGAVLMPMMTMKNRGARIYPRSKGKIIWKLRINKIWTTEQESFQDQFRVSFICNKLFLSYSSICNRSVDRTPVVGILHYQVPIVGVGCWLGILEVVVVEVVVVEVVVVVDFAGRIVASLPGRRRSTPTICK